MDKQNLILAKAEELSNHLLDNFTPSQQREVLIAVENSLKQHYSKIIDETNSKLKSATIDLENFNNPDSVPTAIAAGYRSMENANSMKEANRAIASQA